MNVKKSSQTKSWMHKRTERGSLSGGVWVLSKNEDVGGGLSAQERDRPCIALGWVSGSRDEG
jgi:hypothetical protein